jgi:hypothetical protein
VFLVEGKAKHQAVVDWRAGNGLPARAISHVGGVDVLVDSAPGVKSCVRQRTDAQIPLRHI